MKHNNSFYIQLPRDICQEKFNHLSDAAFRLYVMLKEEEQRLIKEREHEQNPFDTFWRTNKALAKDLGWSESKVKRAKEELRKTGLLEMHLDHLRYPSNGKKSEYQVTYFNIF